MQLSKLSLYNLRNIENAHLHFNAKWVFFVGPNGSGKSSLLEAIYLLGFGRSFRTSQLNALIRFNSNSFCVHAEARNLNQSRVEVHSNLGLEKHLERSLLLKINAENARLSELAAAIAIQLITPESFHLLTTGPQLRREWLDWGVFHVEPSFHKIWQNYQRCLKQRNAALKANERKTVVSLWDKPLVESALKISQLRQEYLVDILPSLGTMLSRLVGEYEVDLELCQGWEGEYLDALESAYASDARRGFTSQGPHRADLKLTIGERPLTEVVSRGQLKKIVASMILAQTLFLQSKTSKKSIILFDDIASELDLQSRIQLFGELDATNSQCFISSIEPDHQTLQALKLQYQMFHVKHGAVEPEELALSMP